MQEKPEKMVRTCVYFTPTELARLKDYATQTNTDASDHMRRALKAYLDRAVPELAAKVQADAAARLDMTGAIFVEGRGWIRPSRTNPYA
jgi:hypothetical protein